MGNKVIESRNYDDKKSWNTPDSKDKGIFIGLTGAQALQDRWFAYESIIYAPSMKNDNDPNSKITFTTLEAGAGYAIDAKTQLTLGYRSQVYDLKDDSRKYTQNVKLNGLIFGASVSF